MEFVRLPIDGVLSITPKRIGDDRGWFTEVFRSDLFCAEVGAVHFVQYNESLSRSKGTIRGLHFQIAPKAQGKLVRCLRGRILDVAVDLRLSSPTFGSHVAEHLSAENGNQLWIPPGFAHGFCTLENDCQVGYMVTEYYSPTHDRGLRWNDPVLAIAWPFTDNHALLSPKDRIQPLLSELGRVFD